MTGVSGGGPSYAGAGVDIAAGDRAVDLIRSAVARTGGPEVVGGIGGFAGLFDASQLTGYRRPLLASATDGVGTKVMIARQLGVYHTVGIDLVGMVVDDLVVCGAEPLFLTDYVVCGRVIPERVAAIVAGVTASPNGVGPSISAPHLPASAISAIATATPPSDTSWQAVTQPCSIAWRT